MEPITVVGALAALAQESRLRIFRLLVEQGPRGLPAGEIGRTLGLAPATLSFHLKELAAARLVSARQDGRFIHYATDFSAMRELLAYLVENCCRGRPDAGDRAPACADGCGPPGMPERPMVAIPKPNVRPKWRVA
ncbi:MAG: ArsR/SmtB family transcription factor [Casimicrobiaceae bacterium]